VVVKTNSKFTDYPLKAAFLSDGNGWVKAQKIEVSGGLVIYVLVSSEKMFFRSGVLS